MVNYSCSTCGKTFKQKGHYTKHLQRKTPCDNINDKIVKIVENKVDEFKEKPKPTSWDLFVKAMSQDRYYPVLEIVANTSEGIFNDFKVPILNENT